MDNKVYLPFYMTYPVRYPYNQENKAARDIEYLREMYPQEAKKLLSAGNSVTETALACGFGDYANFIRVFKKHVGVPPGKYAASSAIKK